MCLILFDVLEREKKKSRKGKEGEVAADVLSFLVYVSTLCCALGVLLSCRVDCRPMWRVVEKGSLLVVGGGWCGGSWRLELFRAVLWDVIGGTLDLA